MSQPASQPARPPANQSAGTFSPLAPLLHRTFSRKGYLQTPRVREASHVAFASPARAGASKPECPTARPGPRKRLRQLLLSEASRVFSPSCALLGAKGREAGKRENAHELLAQSGERPRLERRRRRRRVFPPPFPLMQTRRASDSAPIAQERSGAESPAKPRLCGGGSRPCLFSPQGPGFRLLPGNRRSFGIH